MDRPTMIKVLESLKTTYAAELGDCVAGFDVEIATSDGAGTACWSWGSREVEGPTKLTKKLVALVSKYDPDGDNDPPEEVDDDELELYQAMIRAKCRVGVAYYHIVTSEDGDRFFSTSYDKVSGEWAGQALMGAEITRWEDLTDEQLSEWVEKLGSKEAPKKRQPNAPRSSRAKRTGAR